MEKGAKYNQSWSGSDGQLKAVALAGAQGLCLGAHLGVCVCVCVCVWCLSDRLINLLLSYRERAPTWDLSVSLKFESLNLKRQLKSLGKHLFFFFFSKMIFFSITTRLFSSEKQSKTGYYDLGFLLDGSNILSKERKSL